MDSRPWREVGLCQLPFYPKLLRLLENAENATSLIELGPPQAYIQFGNFNFPYVTIAAGVLYTREMQEDNYDIIPIIKKSLETLLDDIRIHQTPNTTLIKRLPEIDVTAERNMYTGDIRVIFAFRVVQLPKGLGELKAWCAIKKECEEIKCL